MWHDSKGNAPCASRLSWLCMNLLWRLLPAFIWSPFRSLDFAAYLSHAHLRLDRLSARVSELVFVADSLMLPVANIAQAFHQSSQCFLLMYRSFIQHAGSLCCKFAQQDVQDLAVVNAAVSIYQNPYIRHQPFKQTISYTTVFSANFRIAEAAIYQIA